MITVLDESTGLTRITCSTCGIATESVFEATDSRTESFDPAEEIGWRNEHGEIVCPDCEKAAPPRSSIGITSAPEQGPGMAWVSHTCTCGLVRGAVMPFADTQGTGWAQRCLAAVGGGGTIRDHAGTAQDLCPDCFQRANEKGDEKTMTTTNGTSETTEGTKQNPEKIIKRTKNMGTPLTPREKAEKGELVAHLVQRIVEKKEARKNAGAQLKAEIDELDAELKRVSLEISCGTVFRDVQIFEKHVYRLGVYQEVRVDTGEVIFERALTDKERQLDVPLGADEDDTDDDSPGPRNWTPDETEEPSDPDEQEASEESADDQPATDEIEPVLETARGKRRKGSRKGKVADTSEGAES